MKKKNLCILLASLIITVSLAAQTSPREYYQLIIYHYTKAEQEKTIDQYLEAAFLPALQKRGMKTVGVFKPIANDTATDKQIYVWIPVKDPSVANHLPAALLKDKVYLEAGKPYLQSPHNNPAYQRMETYLAYAFELAPVHQRPRLSSDKTERIYEFRSYESPSEVYYRNKVKMFNQGGEIALFKRLGFNAVFYAEVITGSHMPNLIYMTSFENREEREKHWKTFVDDPEWKKLVADPQYQNNVSHADIILLKATPYSTMY